MSGLDRAIDAFRAKDFPRFIEHLLTSEAGASPRPGATPDGPGWVVAVRGTLVFVTLRADEVLLEAPIARLPPRHRLPALRLALELCGGEPASSRVSARGELLLLRFSARLALVSPPVLRYHLREIAHLASRYANLMTVGLEALPAFADDQRGSVPFDAIGRPRKVHVGTAARRSMPPPSHDANGGRAAGQAGQAGGPPPAPKPRNGTRPLPRDDQDLHIEETRPKPRPATESVHSRRPTPRAFGEDTTPGLSPDEGGAAAFTMGTQPSRPPAADLGKGRRPVSDPPELGAGEAIPAILSPMFSDVGSSPRPVPSVAMGTTGRGGTPSEPRPSLSQSELDERHRRGTTAQTGTIPVTETGRRPSAQAGGHPPAVGSAIYEQSSDGRTKPTSRTEIEIDTISRRSPTMGDGPKPPASVSITSFEAIKTAPSEQTLSPSDRLCMLLRHAQSLASLTLEERPATMVWLVRSAVFRAIYDFKDLLPDAVAQLYRCTGIGRDLPSAATRVSGQLQAAEPALVVMERLIVSRAQVPKEKPLAIEPMTSAAQAKEHVARYLVEIDRAPGDPPLRHFLALGALTELLVRTKLPPQTDQRLRDIVSHAQREGAKTSAIDLMMTALQRINS